ncbi:MarR family winged helix-turn-helix transcriptional regulator [Streptomyces sp. C184]|uniref:MarR family winged helix-turn-helix transcriptional regulator n=1 Tax=Streptomyces sp. C184 TaxID=3237121 RepID=UPI0034C67A6D
MDYGVLNALLSVGEPYELRPMDLRERLLLTSGGTSNVLNRLVKAGLLTRQQDASDGRSSWVRLSDTGLHLAEEVVASWTQAQRDFFRDVPADASRTASDALRQILVCLGDLEPPVPQRAGVPVATDGRPCRDAS